MFLRSIDFIVLTVLIHNPRYEMEYTLPVYSSHNVMSSYYRMDVK